MGVILCGEEYSWIPNHEERTVPLTTNKSTYSNSLVKEQINLFNNQGSQLEDSIE